MNTVTRWKATLQQRQRGAVAIMFGLTLVVLFGFMALVFDLGRTYVVRTELQNAADAAALAGAKQLNQTAAGVCCGPDSAAAFAIAIAAENKFKFSSPVDITVANLSVGSCPDDGCMVPVSSITTNELAADMAFLKVDIPSGGLATFFAGIAGKTTTNTYGRAVAGKYLIEITPLAMCSLLDDEAAEFGYERGVSYKVSDINPLGPGTPYWVDPVATTSGACSGNTNDTLPYVCAGKITFTPTVGQPVYTNTGVSDPLLEALDSRFGVISSKNKCDAASAPSDTNIKEYRYDADSATGSPIDWMDIDPTKLRQSFNFDGTGSFEDYGVLWSASRPIGKTVSDWIDLYGGTATSYPETSPYAQTSGLFFSPGTNGKPERRMLHLLIVDCPSGGGICRPATVRGIGKFFMQRKANVPTDKNIYLEFSGLDSEPLSNAEIRLYR